MEIIDIGLAWNWEFDKDFIFGVEHECAKAGLSSYRIEMHNIAETLKKIRSGKIRFRSFLDRASDEEEAFLPIAKYFSRASAFMFNRYDRVEFAKDKAKMHVALLGNNVNVPYTIIISPYNKRKEVELSLTELAHLGRPFIIKPANTTGGGIGVVTGAETLKEILLARQHHKNDTYLLQETIQPEIMGHRPAWFRVFYFFGKSIIC
jgi:glutathione synthase/RimK-type ligase-like ATP-grasp enzyme